MNPSVGDKDPKRKSTPLLGDLDATHKKKSLEDQVVALSKSVQKTMQPVTNIPTQIDTEALEELDQEFPSLIKDTNLLAEQVKKLHTSKITPYQERYKIANEKVSLVLLRSDLDSIIRAGNKNFFLAFEEALDNTAIIDAYPHQATLFKAGVLYKLFLDENPSPRVIEMSIALRADDLPDSFKYIEKEGILQKATWMELAQQAYAEITNSNNENTKQRFVASCEKFKKIYLALKGPSPDNLDDKVKFVFPEISDTLPENELSHALFKQSTRTYINFTGNELSTLQLLIPKHKKKTIIIPEIGGTALDTWMQACLSIQTSVRETKETELRKRTAADEFIFKVSDIISDAQRAMHSDKTGQVFDPHQGYVSYKADPENICKEIQNENEKYQKEIIITKDCKLSGSELTQKFFQLAIKKLKFSLETEEKILDKQYEETERKTSFFNKNKLKSEYKQKKKRTQDTNQQAITEMENFQAIVEKIGVEHIKIFAAEPGGKASYSIPKQQLQEATTEINTPEPVTSSSERQAKLV